MYRIISTVFALCGTLGLGHVALAAQTNPQPGPTTQCTSDRYRQFDFWIGEWEVHDPRGQLQGSNRIEAIQGGCVLQEHWTAASGGTGTSFNIYDFTRDTWHQTWVSGPTLLVLEGRLIDGKMVLEGTTHGQGGALTYNRITWTPVERDVVTQVWETSADGENWQTVFNGRYTRKR